MSATSGFRRSRAPVESPSLRDRITVLKNVPPFIKLVWQTHAGLTVGMIALRLVRAFIPLAILWIGKLIIDEVLTARASALTTSYLWKLVGLEIALAFAAETLSRASAVVESLLGDLFSNRTSVMLMEHAATLDLYQFENPAFYDQLDRARRQTTGRIGLLAQLLSMGQDLITLASLSAALLFYSTWLLLLLAIAVIPSFLSEAHYASLQYSLLFRRTPERRQLDYLRYLGGSDRPAKEVQMFGLAPWLVARYRKVSDEFYEENKRLTLRRSLAATALSLVGLIGYYGAYAVILVRAVTGAISLGSLTFLAAAFMRSRDLIQRLLNGAGDIYTQSLYLKDLFDFFETRPTIRSLPNAPQVPRPIEQGFVFEDVGYRYPDSETWALRGVNFSLRPGQRLALVGGNGAGKTTLVKLLARLYDPTEGRILLDGRELREYDLKSVRKNVGVIFQDFYRYDLRFDENIGIGEIEEVRDYLDTNSATTSNVNGEEPPASIVSAAEKSLAATLLPRLPDSYQQLLGRRFEGGVDLSGGEWQKVALARAYMRDAQVLILDEPTASLDARAEFEVFSKFAGLMQGRMAVIISHRFSTVRMADRLVVLDEGRVVEEGTHDELIERGGLYSELFSLQAQGYR
ncbi:MAG TPA: ABC transporter ATP-binding protein [Pyrinomonadaceae bacterium]|nr:ABC transporter ATP-binding protein [Pyrinomonadaceae bacterium]